MRQSAVITQVAGIHCYYRPGKVEQGSDIDSLKEVLEDRCYSMEGFDVEPQETWLDLGANIGAFALYCTSRGGNVICYEPEPNCFEILKLNADRSELHNCAVTGYTDPLLPFYSREPKDPDNHWRGTVLNMEAAEPEKYGQVNSIKNVYAECLTALHPPFDGIKMDIEGAEMLLIDRWLLPPSEKLVMEYHTCRDWSIMNLNRRLRILESRFNQVRYPKEYDEAIAAWRKGEVTEYKPEFDRLIFCWDPK